MSNSKVLRRPNPQLFHDYVGNNSGGSARNRKRKRKEEDECPRDDEESDLDLDLNFFAKRDAKPARPVEKAPVADSPPPIDLLNEEECRDMLRSHRLKLTILSRREEPQPKAKRSKKKQAAAAAKTGSKEDKKHMFPQPLTSLVNLRGTYGISPRLANNLEKLHYRTPTEVQMGSLPLLLNPELALSKAPETSSLRSIRDGADFMAVAPTGSGKTLSFLIPAINSVMRRRAGATGDKQHELEAIVVAPTKELAEQIANEGKRLAVGTGVRVVAMKKGMRVMAVDSTEKDETSFASEDDSSEESAAGESDHDSGVEVAAAKSTPPATKADVLVTTPMLLLNFLSGGSSTPRKSTPTVRALILDEADVLLDPLFREQTLSIWSACTNPDLQVTFWSATVGSSIEELVQGQTLWHAKSREVQPRPLVRLVVGLKDTAVPNIAHKLVFTMNESGKVFAMAQILRTGSGVDFKPPLPYLVFTQTIERATALYERVKVEIPPQAGGPSRIAVFHSSLADSLRSDILRRFRSGDVWVLITTDVLSRGIDFAGVKGVINYDVPTSAAAYVHRVGRTARVGREGCMAVTLWNEADRPHLKIVANVIATSERQAGRTPGDASSGVPQWLLDSLPKVAKADKKELKKRGVESRRPGSKSKITSQSGWERRKEHNMQGAIQASKRRKRRDKHNGGGGGGGGGGGDDKGEGSEWGGFND